jgi:hypothetical protein
VAVDSRFYKEVVAKADTDLITKLAFVNGGGTLAGAISAKIEGS